MLAADTAGCVYMHGTFGTLYDRQGLLLGPGGSLVCPPTIIFQAAALTISRFAHVAQYERAMPAASCACVGLQADQPPPPPPLPPPAASWRGTQPGALQRPWGPCQRQQQHLRGHHHAQRLRLRGAWALPAWAVAQARHPPPRHRLTQMRGCHSAAAATRKHIVSTLHVQHAP
jgi:hypothetical protein